MKKEIIQDERILEQRRKIQSDGYQILIVCLLVSIVIQQFILKVSFSHIAAEFICLSTVSLYVAVRNLCAGNNIYASNKYNKKNIIVNSVFQSLWATVLIAVLAGVKSIWNLVIFFICFTLSFVVGLSILYYINSYIQKKIERKLNDDENIK